MRKLPSVDTLLKLDGEFKLEVIENDQAFAVNFLAALEKLRDGRGQRGRMLLIDCSVTRPELMFAVPNLQIRYLATAGGMQYGIQHIHHRGMTARTGSGSYFADPMSCAFDAQKQAQDYRNTAAKRFQLHARQYQVNVQMNDPAQSNSLIWFIQPNWTEVLAFAFGYGICDIETAMAADLQNAKSAKTETADNA